MEVKFTVPGMLPELINYTLALAIAQVIQWGADLWDFASTKSARFSQRS